MSILKRCAALCVIIALCALTGCGGGAKVEITADGSKSDGITAVSSSFNEKIGEYILCAKNESYSLFYEPTGLTVMVRDNKTGHITTSAAEPDEGSSETWKNFVNSGIVLEYYKGTATTVNKTNMYSGKPEVKITNIENGIAAQLNFKNIGISLKVFITLTDSGIKAEIPNSSVKESNEGFKLAAIYVLPFLGYTRLGETDGYMLIPDGCGALIDLKDNNEKYTQPYKAKIYGGNYSVEENNIAVQQFEESIATQADAAGISYPVFGMVHTKDRSGFVGIVESGKYNAEILAYPNGVVTEYNWVTARYIYREVYLFPTSQTGGINTVQANRETFDISVSYDFVSGENASYVGLAKAYRNYLIENGVLDGKSGDGYSLKLDFFAGDVEKALFGTDYVSMTDVGEMADIIVECIENGAESITAVYKGWQKNGIFGALPEKIKFDGETGGYSDFKDLAEALGSKVSLQLYGDFLNTYSKKGNNGYIYRLNGKVYSDETYWELHKIRYRFDSEKAAQLLNGYAAKLDENIGIAIDGISNEAYSYAVNDKKDMYSRQSFCNDIAGAVENVKNAALYAPNDYLWKYTGSYYDFRLYGSDYKFVSREVPFLSIALKGSIPLYGEYVNFKADNTEYLLKMVESGVYPSFLLTESSPSELMYTDSSSLFSCEYSEYKEMIKEYNEIFEELSAATEGAVIENHTVNGDLSTTVYSNGTAVYVNYGEKAVNAENIEILPSSYVIKAGDGV